MEVAMTDATQSNAAVLVRLRRIEGQIRGLHRMVDEDEQCMDVLTQISAVTKALQSVAILMLEGHLSECVTSAMGDDTVDMDEKLQEVTAAIARLVRS
jgi:DNA-binding FrmR family transcriptional regulator